MRTPDERAGFRHLYAAHARGVRAAAAGAMADRGRAEDVAQDVFERFCRNPAAFDPARGDVGPYLRLMARSRAIDVHRADAAACRARDRLALLAEPGERIQEHPSARLEREEDRAAVRAALRTLPATQREALVLRYWRGLTLEEIARELDIPLGTAKSRVRLGLDKVGSALSQPDAA